MNATHLHLLLNHVTVLGNFLGVVLLAYAVFRKNEGVKRGSLFVFAITALVALPVYFTGRPAMKVVQFLPDVSKPLIARHEEVAQLALVGMVLVGLASVAGLILSRRGKLISAWLAIAILVLSLTSAVVTAWTANLGGQIRHSELRAQGDS